MRSIVLKDIHIVMVLLCNHNVMIVGI